MMRKHVGFGFYWYECGLVDKLPYNALNCLIWQSLLVLELLVRKWHENNDLPPIHRHLSTKHEKQLNQLHLVTILRNRLIYHNFKAIPRNRQHLWRIGWKVRKSCIFMDFTRLPSSIRKMQQNTPKTLFVMDREQSAGIFGKAAQFEGRALSRTRIKRSNTHDNST